jgi:phosphate transport system substrate-binding protein
VFSRLSRLAGLVSAGALIAASAAVAQDLTGAGATFPDPIYKKWFSDYAAKTGVKINYQAIGSGGGIKQLQEQTVDFGASDAPMTDAEIAKAKGPVLHVPTVLGAVVITYNLAELTKPLNLTGDVIANIYRGKITKWNAPEIKTLNAGVVLPNKDILVVHRTDGSGTTYVFSDYLASASVAWKTGPGRGKELQWPVGLGGAKNDGVTAQVKQTPGSIGYVELAYARQNKLPVASIKNSAGIFVAPTIESITASGAGIAAKLPATSDLRVSLVNSPGTDAYPISAMTFILLYQNQTDAAKGKKLVDFLRWALHDGQAAAGRLDYAPLPKNIVTILDKRLTTIKLLASR